VSPFSCRRGHRLQLQRRQSPPPVQPAQHR
jgi:hypothetical protein